MTAEEIAARKHRRRRTGPWALDRDSDDHEAFAEAMHLCQGYSPQCSCVGACMQDDECFGLRKPPQLDRSIEDRLTAIERSVAALLRAREGK